MRLLSPMLAGVIACAMLSLSNNMIAGQEVDQPKPQESFEQKSTGPEKQEPIKGYPVRDRQMGGPTDVEWDLDNSFPKRDSVLELILRSTKDQHQ
jgi:hypothetical protein